jgi:hypothetical protein
MRHIVPTASGYPLPEARILRCDVKFFYAGRVGRGMSLGCSPTVALSRPAGRMGASRKLAKVVNIQLYYSELYWPKPLYILRSVRI